LSHSEHHCN